VAAVSEASALPRGRAEAPPTWKVWTNLWIVYIVWGSTYLAISLMVETIPPLFGAGARFVLVGAIVLPVLAARRGLRAMRPTRGEQVPSGLAALLVASIPLWVILLRRFSGERVPARSIGAVLVGFAGVAILVKPQGEATLLALLACVGAAAMWATGSFASPRVPLPREPLVSTAWMSLLGGLACIAAGLLTGEAGDIHPAEWSARSILGLAYLVTFGSLLAFTAYAWLLQNAPISKVSTYAYVNPVIAVVLGWLVNSEPLTALTLLGAGVIVASVALVVRVESR
jgi:drug/metabolite transporter (DMT)-like permease